MSDKGNSIVLINKSDLTCWTQINFITTKQGRRLKSLKTYLNYLLVIQSRS